MGEDTAISNAPIEQENSNRFREALSEQIREVRMMGLSEYRFRLAEFLKPLECPDALKEIVDMVSLCGVESTVMWLEGIGEDI